MSCSSKSFYRPAVLAVVVLTAIGLSTRPARAQSGLFNVERLVREAGIIFSGRVVDVVTGEKDPRMNLYTTYYTFAVEEALYGVDTDSLTIKQYGGEAGGRSYYPPGVPRFEVGETVVVFFYPPSRIGMTSTVAKGQGKFLVDSTDSSRVRVVQNETHNRNLFRRVRNGELLARPEWMEGGSEGPIDYEPFVSSIRNLVGVLKKR